MKSLTIYFALGVAFAIAMIFASVAHAAGEILTAYPIDVHEPLNYILGLVIAAATGVFGYLMALFQKKTGITLKPEHQEYLDNAVASALLYAHDKAQAQLGHINDPMVKNKIIADAANAVLETVPNLLRQLGITPETLRQMVEDRLSGSGGINGPAQPSQ